VVSLLFLSGLCALVYQVTWLRELRLVFGASTMAISAVLAIFMGGLGLGSYFLGRYAEQHRQPLKLYGYLEVGIAVAAFASPFLISLVRMLYIAQGGSQSMGLTVATIVRLVSSALIIGIPTFLMGGTLPALVRAVETDADVDRSDVGLLYGINTLGAVTGVTLAFFFMLEHFGTHATTWLASLLNGMVGIGALILAHNIYKGDTATGQEEIREVPAVEASGVQAYNRYMILAAAAVVGFVFLLMEIVWYRMLAPLLGGTTYTFGLILAVALLGIGIGGWLYSRRGVNAPVTLVGFAITCGLEAFFLAVPFALGDRIAIWTALLRSLGTMGFDGYVIAWLQTTAIVVLPGAIVAGYQFPMLVALMGRGRCKVAQQTGYVYAWNTIGSIIGSLAGGFGLLPLLSATGSWQMAIWLLVLLALGMLFYSLRYEKINRFYTTVSPIIIIGAILLLFSQGPTAAWRHTPIGAGEVQLVGKSFNEIRRWLHQERSSLVWEADGLESVVGMKSIDAFAFYINGKSDGSAIFDSPTFVMGPLVSGILHPNPKKALVIGMGTGTSTGWLAEIPSMEQVDQVELEKVIYDVARLCPSNPYRAGIASLYTSEFYQSVANRLNKGGMFSQWVQGYKIDSRTLRIIYATLHSVFPVVEIWETLQNDLLFVCSMEERSQSVKELRERIKKEPFRSAMLYAWGNIDLEGFLSHYVANPELARRIAAKDLENGLINTDDKMVIEFSFAKSLAASNFGISSEFRQKAWESKMHLPVWFDESVNWESVINNFIMLAPNQGRSTPNSRAWSKDRQMRLAAYNHFNSVQLQADNILQMWNQQGQQEPKYPLEIAMLAEAYAEKGDSKTTFLVNRLKEYYPVTAAAILARYHWRTGNKKMAMEALTSAFTNFRIYPWARYYVMFRTLHLGQEMAATSPEVAEAVFELIKEPFSVRILETARKFTMLYISPKLNPAQKLKAVQQFEPHIPWEEEFLKIRLQIYRDTNHSMALQAEKDLKEFLKNKEESLDDVSYNK
jgi:predicted membrane-bound spermidine synthase